MEFEHQFPIEEESGWAPEQSGCFGEEENVMPFLGPDGCTVQLQVPVLFRLLTGLRF